jgi:hypothetical protein
MHCARIQAIPCSSAGREEAHDMLSPAYHDDALERTFSLFLTGCAIDPSPDSHRLGMETYFISCERLVIFSCPSERRL